MLLSALLITVSACVTEPTAPERNAAQTICEAAKAGSTPDGAMVTLEADYISDGLERSFLHDDQCPKILISPYDGPNTIKDEGYRAFNRILDAHSLKLELIKVRVKLSGRLRMEAPNRYRLDVVRYIESSEQKAR